MSKLKKQSKIERVMRFLVSFARPEVAAKMALRGFSAEDREEGFALVDKAVGRNLSLPTGSSERDKDLVAAVDAWENVWFDVADAALRRSHPEAHAQVFHKLSKTSGPMVIPNVKVFLDRLAQLGEAHPEALELLAKRGLGDTQRKHAEALLEQLRADVSEQVEVDAQAQLELLDAALDEMWAWYLDWSVTARTVIKSKRLRIIMGLSSAARSSSSAPASEAEAELELELEDELDAA